MRLFFPSNISIAVAICLVGQTTVMASGLDAWLAAHSVSTVTKTATSSVAKPTSSKIAPAAFARCPTNCSHAGYDPANWDAYHSVARLALCNQTMLLDFSLYNLLDDPSTHTSIRSCTADNRSALDTLAGKKETSASFSAVSLCPWSSQTSRFNWPRLMQTGKALPRTSHLPFRKLVTFWLNNQQGKRASPLPSLEKPSLACLLALRFSSRVPLRQSSKTLLLKSRTEVSRTAF